MTEKQKVLAIILTIFVALILLGGAIFTIAMSIAGWDFSVLNTVRYEQHSHTETQTITRLDFDFDTEDIDVYFDETATEVRVEYPEKFTKKGDRLTKISITEENDTLKIVQTREKPFFFEWNIGKVPHVRVYLPAERTYAIDFNTDTGNVSFH